jgi:hypothetical protein
MAESVNSLGKIVQLGHTRRANMARAIDLKFDHVWDYHSTERHALFCEAPAFGRISLDVINFSSLLMCRSLLR